MKIYAKLVLLLTLILSLFLAACGDAPTSIPRPIVRADVTAIAATGANPLPAMTTAATGATPTSRPLEPLPTDAVPPTLAGNRTQPPTVNAPTAPASGQATPGQDKLTTVPGTIRKSDGKIVDLSVELAQTPQEQQTGLMGRTKMADGEGMLFIFAQPGTGGFWMKNTLLPLSIAFIDQKGVIVDIRDMQPLSEETVAPTTPYIWALEVPQGYFTRQGIKIGDTFTVKR